MDQRSSEARSRRTSPAIQHRVLSSHVPDYVLEDTESIPPDRGDRLVAALAYIGIISYLLMVGLPGRTFVQRHQRVAALIHTARAFLTFGVLAIWWGFVAQGDEATRLGALGRDAAMLIAAGVPWHVTFQEGVLPWMLTPLVTTWILSIGGLLLAASGKTADVHAFINADWNDVVYLPRWFSRTPEEERRIAREARERHLERIQRSARTYASERKRQERLEEIRDDIDYLHAQRDHFDQLLGLGEISQRRYDEAQAAIQDDIAELQRDQTGLTRRVTPTATNQRPESMRVSRADRSTEAFVNTVAIVTPSGIPLFTYGKFQLDDAIVAGILSAFDSLSEEVFGSRVHKTQLAEGQVLYFAHGMHVLILAIFDDEPSPRQVEQLKTMLRQFEQANRGQLQREQYDPQHMHQIDIPFTFARPVA